MNNQDKTTEELIKELQKLQQENDFLKLEHDIFINKHSQAEKALRESEENYRNLLELAPDAFFQGDEKGNIIMANKKATLLTGYVKDELLTMNMKDFFLPSFLNQKPLRYDLLDRGETVSIEREVSRKDGSIVIVEMNSRKMPNNTYQSFMRDISERILAESALRDSEHLYRAIFENTGTSSIIIEEDTIIALTNTEWVNLTGYSREEMEGKMSWTQFVVPEDLARMKEYHKARRLDTSASPHKYEFRFVRRNGEIRNMINCVAMIPESKRSIASLMDITERKQAEETLKVNEEKLKTIIETSPDGIAITALDGTVQFVTHKTVSLWGCDSIDELIGKNVMEFVDSSYHDKAKFFISEMLNGNLTGVAEYIMVKKDGSRFYCESNANILHDVSNNPIGILYVNRDITKRKEVENELISAKQTAEENEAKYSSIVKILPDGVIIHSNGIIVYANESTIKILKGQNQEDYLGKPAINFVHPDYRELAIQRIKKSIVENARAEQVDEVFIDSEGNPVNVLVTGIPFQYQGQPSMLTVFTDITKIKETEQELIKAKESAEESEEIFNQFMRYSPIYVFFKDADIRPIRLSHNYEKMIGKPINELLGKSMFELFPSELAKGMVADDLKILQECKVLEIEEEHNGRYYSTIKFPVHMKGKPRFLAGFTIDITERKNSELLLKEKNEELIKAKEKAEESDRLKTAFLANMSHEIRTPMNGILGFADLLKKPQLSGEQQQNYISIIETSGVRMLNIINDIIDISKIESGETKVSISDTNINEQINHIFNFFNPEAEQKGLSLLNKSALPTKDAIIRTDCEKLFAILTNLVKNAIKFTDKGSVEIGYAKKDEFLEFYVKDTGIGIPKNRQQAVFERFVQADVSDSRAFQGAGLGLAITKAYVEMLDGQIWFESEEQKGTVFFFTIPNNVATKEQIVNKVLHEDKSISFNTKLKVLVAEDDEPSDLYITLLLNNYNCEVLHAKTGSAAVDICRNNTDINLILMDIKMPEMNGYEATQRIRQFNEKVIIFAQTAYALAGDKEKAIEAGCNHYLTKPLNQSLFKELIQLYFNK